MHLQIASQMRAPGHHLGNPNSTFGNGEKFLPQRWRTRRMLLLAFHVEGELASASVRSVDDNI
jgi:hypothetical protein